MPAAFHLIVFGVAVAVGVAFLYATPPAFAQLDALLHPT
jgi:hypothetical protein